MVVLGFRASGSVFRNVKEHFKLLGLRVWGTCRIMGLSKGYKYLEFELKVNGAIVTSASIRVCTAVHGQSPDWVLEYHT